MHVLHGASRKVRMVGVIAALVLSCAPVAAGAEEGAAPGSPIANWQTLEQFLQQPDVSAAPVPSAPDKPTSTALLPSLGPERRAAPLLAPVIIKPVEFAALPPLFERAKPVLPQADKKLQPDKKILPQLVATVEKPLPPANTEACAPPEMTKRAKNYARDSATLEALQQAVKDLKLDERLDFMQPAKASAIPATPAQNSH